ncbi:MAG: hypothetical protein CMJ18_12940 [Phycisphaeraceae bacterium]|nr:hypothetical protein [Phycisphaeraceae bacterium]
MNVPQDAAKPAPTSILRYVYLLVGVVVVTAIAVGVALLRGRQDISAIESMSSAYHQATRIDLAEIEFELNAIERMLARHALGGGDDEATDREHFELTLSSLIIDRYVDSILATQRQFDHAQFEAPGRRLHGAADILREAIARREGPTSIWPKLDLFEIRCYQLDRLHEIAYRRNVRYIRSNPGTVVYIGLVALLFCSGGAAFHVLLRLTKRAIDRRLQAEEILGQSEYRFRTIVETTEEWIWEINLDGLHTYSNPAVVGILGYAVDEVVGTNSFHLIYESDQKAVRGRLQHLIDNQEGWRGWVIRWKHRDGSIRFLESNAVPLFDIDRRLVGFRGADRDITRRMKAEEETRSFQDELVHVQKLNAIGTLASGVAHDFNNLLTAIDGYADLIQAEMVDDDPALKYARMIGEVTRQAAGVSQALLTFARRSESDKRPINIIQVTDEAILMLQRLLPSSIVLQRRLDRDDLWVFGNDVQIKQVLMNLALNARDAMPAGGSLEIRVEGVESKAMITVSDTGEGMTPETVNRIFEPFFTTKPREQGTGLGLDVIHGIIQDHGGSIDVDSRPGRGTSLNVHLPRCDAPTAIRSPEASAPDAHRGVGLILVAEDNEHIRELLCEALTIAGYQTVQTGDGDETVAAFRRHADAVHLVILDLDLPKKTGQQCLKELRDGGSRVPVLIVSGNPGEISGESANGGVYVMQKPFRMTDVVVRINSILNSVGEAASLSS